VLDPALRWIVLGLAYKLIVADNLGNLSGLLRIDPDNAWHVWFECLVFGLRIYFDFAGYSFIAVGLGILFGVRLTLNFLSPYWSQDLREFWRRWHVSLGSWLRDYIYLPLGGRKRRWIFNTLIVFGISGIWHGAGWGFVIWGLMHGAGIVFCGLGKSWPLPAILKRATTFFYAIAAWLFFFERDGDLLWEKATALLNPLAYLPAQAMALPSMFASPSDTVTVAFILMVGICALAAEGLEFRKKIVNPEPYRTLRKTPVIVLLAALTVWLAPMEESSFIYFNF
jgi:D-alanyl-lipoteichoic acid acyltransferase DltB (MBOAT superfamily)